MCDINKKTKLKTKTIYKVVIQKDEEYLAVYSKMPISIGEIDKNFNCVSHPKISSLYNENMIGRTSGFGSKKVAFLLKNHTWRSDLVILKMVIGGDIMQGTTAKISGELPEHYTTYAGTEILSFEEVK